MILATNVRVFYGGLKKCGCRQVWVSEIRQVWLCLKMGDWPPKCNNQSIGKMMISHWIFQQTQIVSKHPPPGLLTKQQGWSVCPAILGNQNDPDMTRISVIQDGDPNRLSHCQHDPATFHGPLWGVVPQPNIDVNVSWRKVTVRAAAYFRFKGSLENDAGTPLFLFSDHSETGR